MADAKKKKSEHDDRMEKYAKANSNGFRVIKKADDSPTSVAEEAPEDTDTDSEQEEDQLPKARGPRQEEKMVFNPKTGKEEWTLIIYD